MYVIVEALKDSSFSISVQVVRAKQSVQQSSLSISQDITYNFRLSSKSNQVLKTHPIYGGIYFKYQTIVGKVGVCLLNAQNQCSQIKSQPSKNGQLQQKQITETSPKFLLTNPSEQQVEVEVSYHSGDYSNCQRVKLGEYSSELVNHGKCFTFNNSQPMQKMKLQNQRIIIYIGMLLVIATIVLLLTYVFLKKVVPMISRMKTSVMVEQDPASNKKIQDDQKDQNKDNNMITQGRIDLNELN